MDTGDWIARLFLLLMARLPVPSPGNAWVIHRGGLIPAAAFGTLISESTALLMISPSTQPLSRTGLAATLMASISRRGILERKAVIRVPSEAGVGRGTFRCGGSLAAPAVTWLSTGLPQRGPR